MLDIHSLMLVARGDVLGLHQGGLRFFGKFVQVHNSKIRFADLLRTDFHTRALAGIGGKTRRTSVTGLSALSKLLNARVRFSHRGLRPFGLWGGAYSGFFLAPFHGAGNRSKK